MLHELHRCTQRRRDRDAKRRDERLDDATDRTQRAAGLRCAGRWELVAMLVEMIDERRLELDEPAAALLRGVTRIFERARPAIGEQLLELSVLEREQVQLVRDARRERDIVGDDDR